MSNGSLSQTSGGQVVFPELPHNMDVLAKLARASNIGIVSVTGNHTVDSTRNQGDVEI